MGVMAGWNASCSTSCFHGRPRGMPENMTVPKERRESKAQSVSIVPSTEPFRCAPFCLAGRALTGPRLDQHRWPQQANVARQR